MRNQISEIKPKAVPRAFASDCAAIAIRINLPLLALRILNPIVRSLTPIHPEATPAERARYGAALIRLGAHEEARQVLRDIDPNQAPESLLYLAIANFAQWDYRAAIPLLRSYVLQEALTSYQKTVGEVNLAAAYVVERKLSAAETALEGLRTKTSQGESTLLWANVLELSAQLEVLKGDFVQAREYLSRTAPVLSDSKSGYGIWARKWSRIVDVLEAAPNPSAESLAALEEVRAHARRDRDWETVRECDFYRAMAQRDDTAFARVYFGTPFESYRSRMRVLYRPAFQMPASYVRVPELLDTAADSLVEKEATRIFDLAEAHEVGNSAVHLIGGQLLHRMLQCFVSDAYRPFSFAQIYSQLFPNEYLNPESSPKRVHALIERLRSWMRESDIPLGVHVEGGEYRLVAVESSDGPYGLLRTESTKTVSRNDEDLLKLKAAWPYKSFTAAEAAGVLGRSAQRLLKWAVENKKVYRSGQGRSTFYRFAR